MSVIDHEPTWKGTVLLDDSNTKDRAGVENITQLLQEVRDGNANAEERLLDVVYRELRVVAHNRLRNEKPGRTLQTTALVHEAYLRLAGREGPDFANRAHFFSAASEAMRRILIESARSRNALKRGGDRQRVDLQPELVGTPEVSVDVLALSDALDKFESHDERACQIVKLRYFIGLSVEEIAEVFGVSVRTVHTDWTAAKLWLKSVLEADGNEV